MSKPVRKNYYGTLEWRAKMFTVYGTYSLSLIQLSKTNSEDYLLGVTLTRSLLDWVENSRVHVMQNVGNHDYFKTTKIPCT